MMRLSGIVMTAIKIPIYTTQLVIADGVGSKITLRCETIERLLVSNY